MCLLTKKEIATYCIGFPLSKVNSVDISREASKQLTSKLIFKGTLTRAFRLLQATSEVNRRE